MGLIREESVSFRKLFLKNKVAKIAEIGLVIGEQGISIAFISDPETNKLTCDYFKRDQLTDVYDWVVDNKLLGKTVHAVLNCKQYHLYQVEPPSVPKEELNQALLYNLRDRLDYPVHEAQIDSFIMPDDTSRGGRTKVNVVAAHLPLLKNKIELIHKVGLQPGIIDIPEMAFKHLLQSNASMQKGICLVSYHEQFVTLMIYRQNHLYLSRNINIPSWRACLEVNSDSASENLVLEIQRTLDYYQSQLGQPPVAEIIIPDWSEPLQPLIEYLGDNLTSPVIRLNNADIVKENYDMTALRQLSLAKAAIVSGGINATS